MNSHASFRRPVSPALIWLSLAVFLIALLPRLGALGRYVTSDELRWVDRSLHFADALARGDLAFTIQSGHPGITTMWLGSLGSRGKDAWPSALPEFDPRNADVARFLAQYLDAARLPVILMVALNFVALFLLLDQLIDRRTAFLAAGLAALDPFAVALGSILHVDALMATFSLNSLAALCVARHRQHPARWLMLSGVFAGLATLSKSPGAVLGVAVLIILAGTELRQRRSIFHTIKAMFQWSIVAAATFSLLAPSMWVQPISTLQLMRTTAENFSETAHAVNFFNGSNARDPGPSFYPVVLAFRSTPLWWLGLSAAAFLLVRAKSEHDRRLRSCAWIYGIFALLFIGVITLGAKKLDRYVLPALEALTIVSALGLAFVMERIGTRIYTDDMDNRRQRILNAAIVAILIVSAIQFVPVWPLTLRAYNSLLGGYDGARQVLPVGGGESAEVGRALSVSPYADQWIAVSDVVGTAPYFAGKLSTNTAAGLTVADQMVFTAIDFQLTPDVAQKWIGTAAPVMTITVQERPYAWLYANQWLAADQQRLVREYQTGDWLLTDAAAQVPVPAESTQVLATELSEAEAIDRLQEIAQTHDRVWVIHYAAAPRRVLDPLSRLLELHASALESWSSPLSEGTLYALPGDVSFEVKPAALKGGVNFGDQIQLHGIQLLVPHVQPGQAIGIFGQWTATGPAAQMEVSVVDEVGHVWSTSAIDVPLQEAEPRPRGRRINVPVPLTMPPGDYQLVLNVIDTTSGSPIHTRQSDGSRGGIDWLLGSVTIDPAQTPIDAATRKPPLVLNAKLGGLIAIGSDLPPDPIITGDPWTLALEWASTSERSPVLDVQWEWAQSDRVVYSTTLPLNPYSTDRWRTGEVLQSKYDFRLPIDVPSGKYDLQFQVLERAAQKPIGTITRLTTVNVASRPRSFARPDLPIPLDVQFGDLAKLVGADVNRSGTQLTLTLFWQAQAVTTTNYTAFVRLINADGSIAQQIDNWQIAFDAPTSTWIPGQVIADQYVFEVSSSADLPSASRFGVGLYNAADGERLPAIEDGQPLPQDQVIFP